MKSFLKLIAVMAIAASVVSCSTRHKQAENVGLEDQTGTPSEITSAFLDKANSLGVTDSGRYNWDDILSNKTVFFEYDSSSLDAESQLIVEAHAEFLAGNGGSVALGGHTDERGTREYNISLGEGRGDSVANIMRALGVAQADVVSYGEESPISAEYWENRRVEISY